MIETDAIGETLETHKAERLSRFTARKHDNEGSVQSLAISAARGLFPGRNSPDRERLAGGPGEGNEGPPVAGMDAAKSCRDASRRYA